MPPFEDTPTPERSLVAQRLAQYVMRGRCERFLRLSLFPSEANAYARRFRVSFEPLSPLLSEGGQLFEREQVRELAERERVVDLTNRPPADLVAEIAAQPPGRTFYYQPKLEGRIGPWPCEGRADLVGVTRSPGGDAEAVVIDIKASRRETVGYRLQVAFYARLLRGMLRDAGVGLGRVSGAIASRDHGLAGELEGFDLGLYDAELERLVAAPDSDVARTARSAFLEARYHLNPACDSCAYNSLCFLESAERDDLSLVPLLSASEKRALRTAGIATTRDLAGLMEYGEGAMAPAPGREGDVARAGARWPLGGRIPALAQRARAALGERDRSVEARRYLLGSDFGTLPDTEHYPDLVRVFVDAQRDYLEDRLYLVAAHVAGPAGEADVVEMTPGPPDTDAERALLVAWVQKLLPAIARASADASAPLHVYLYDRRGQRSLLGALERHFDALCAIPAFHDLLTSSPALSQGMVSFLEDEVRARLNLGVVSQNLYQVAQALGFRWRDGETDFRRLFRARVFDNRRPYERDPGTGALWAAAGDGEDVLWLESAARFGTEIPLEYAYAAWGRLGADPDADDGARSALHGYLGTTAEQVAAFAAMRCRALRHVEESFTYKNRRVEKKPLELDRLDRVDTEPGEVPLARSLESFLLLEHHAARQEALLRLALPPELRAQTGRSALLLCESCEKRAGGEVAIFAYADASGAAATADVGSLRFREDSWVVLNPLAGEDGAPPPSWSLVHGRLGVVERLDSEGVEVRLMGMTFKDSAFRYWHRLFKPEPGALYTLDEMVDDLNGDKFLEACRNAGSNALYRWIEDPAEGRRPRPVRPARLRAGVEVAEKADHAQAPHGLTEAQRRIVGDHFADRVLVVQGPPGTGKSHTLGFAILARALALATPVRPFRVAVAARTHAATTIALGSVARRARQLAEAFPGDPRVEPLSRLKVVKVCGDAGDRVPEDVGRILAGGDEGFNAAEQWDRLLAEPLLVVGGTPSGLYNLVKRGQSRRGGMDWTREYFDLVVVDEASQMGIAEALTASAFLREDGQFIAIGDHRQMPPILAHAWDQESRRDLARARPHLAVFDYLRQLGFASAALDQSFRIPAEVADFLQRHVYSKDGIDFRSANRERLAALDGLEGWLAAALAPEHPFVVVEHDESGSQQANEFEARLVEEVARAAERLGLDAASGVGVVVPHNAQRSLLRARLPWLAVAVDTVERFQGGERDLVVVSATVSDREYASLESSFLLEPRRLTVAVSRPRRKLVVVASRAVFDLIPADLDEYERGALWKHLRHECAGEPLWEGEVDGHFVAVRALASHPREVATAREEP
jgi:hypothetical protein